MSRPGLWDRVRSWFGGKQEAGAAGAPSARRCSLGPAESAERLAFPGGAAAMGTSGPAAAVLDDLAETAATPANRLPARNADSADGPAPSRLDPMDPDWIGALERLPERLAESAARSAAGARSLEEIAYELEGHREAGRAIAQSVGQLPRIAADQVELHHETNKLLTRQADLMEAVFDSLTSMRSAFRSVEESSKRNVLALGQLESCHRQVLFEYQAMLIKAHRRVAYMAVLAILLAAGAIGGLAYVWQLTL